MLKTKELLIFSILAIINQTHSTNTKIIYPATVKKADVDSLIPLRHEQSLPFVFFDKGADGHLQFPLGLTEIEIVDGRLASGTEFFTLPPKDQTFFCPVAEKKRRCLAPKQFEKSQVLECDIEAEATVYQSRTSSTKCGPGGIGVWMVIIYEICAAQLPFTYSSRSFHPYSFCLDETSKRNLFVYYDTYSAKLLAENILEREREITFEVSKETKEYVDHSQAKTKPQYEFQKMVPSENMPFALWRKTTYNDVNMSLQHEKLIDLWNEINHHIRMNVIETSQLPRTIVTGLVDIPENELPHPKDENQIYNIWATLVIDKNLKTHKGIAILMNNFITEDKSDKEDTEMSEPNEVKLYIDKICEKISCVNTLNRKFQDVGGQVRCCRVTQTIKEFFQTEEMNTESIDTILQIRNLTYEVKMEEEGEQIRNLTHNEEEMEEAEK